MKALFFIFCCLLCLSCRSQNSLITHKGKLIEMPNYFDERAVVISDEPFFMSSRLKTQKFFQPQDSDLVNTEKILRQNFIRVINARNGEKSFDERKDKDMYRGWYRQYFTFVNKDNEKVVLINLLKCCHNIRKCYPDWQQQIVLKISENNPCSGEARFIVNLTKNTISMP